MSLGNVKLCKDGCCLVLTVSTGDGTLASYEMIKKAVLQGKETINALVKDWQPLKKEHH